MQTVANVPNFALQGWVAIGCLAAASWSNFAFMIACSMEKVYNARDNFMNLNANSNTIRLRVYLKLHQVKPTKHNSIPRVERNQRNELMV